ncbi:hypothetical protein PV11_03459 [Exophiala sideris]|uniref:Uncharacterized protein n=1 Tax=Exophiala sideris TaxID=1016849 RepID=A0A0D1X1A5_9EURO|nr:hypothetical protein PV11_03459 [Exophiala sideris]
MAGVFSQDPKVLVNAVNSVNTADNLNSYLRRFALARLARLYAETVANRGRLGHDKDSTCLSLRTSTNKAYKAAAYVSLIQHVWDVAFPARFQGRNKTRSGLIDSDESDAVRWNHYKRKLSKQIEAGQRWLKFADKFGWSALGLVTRDWFIEENKVLANDRIPRRSLQWQKEAQARLETWHLTLEELGEEVPKDEMPGPECRPPQGAAAQFLLQSPVSRRMRDRKPLIRDDGGSEQSRSARSDQDSDDDNNDGAPSQSPPTDLVASATWVLIVPPCV